MRKAKYDRHGVYAILPQCWGIDFMLPDMPAPEPFDLKDGTAIVRIEGPLTHHASWCWDSYDGIVERVEAAIASKADRIMLLIDSPGGECSGCFDAARSIRALCEAAGKPLFAYVDGTACSGGYALACAADEIAVSETSFVGSIGVIATIVDATRMDAAFGLRYEIVTSGARKADGNPHAPISDGAVKALQTDVTSLAELFFDLVSDSRGLDVEAVRGLEAGVMHGQAAIDSGLADILTTKSAYLAMLASGERSRPSAENKGEPAMGWKEEMRKAAEEGDEEAQTALAALDDEEKKDDEKKSDDSEKEDKKDAASAEGEDEKEKKKDEDKKDASASASSVDAITRIGKLERENASFKAEREASERNSLLSGFDLTEGQVAVLRAQPLAEMKKTLEAFGDSRRRKPIDPSVAGRTTGTRGATQGGTGSHGLPETDADRIDARMGIARKSDTVRWEGRDKIFPASTMSKQAARELLDSNQKKGRVR